ncbi:MAG TPA: FAD-dependent oxidoreductase, partial [Gaiellaceae bacterium]
HLVRELDFLLPVYRDGPYGRPAIRAALGLYSLLGGSPRGRIASPGRAAATVPFLRLEGLAGAGLYADAQTNDARLCLANVRAAADAGAAVANRVEVTAIGRAGGRTVVTAQDLCGGTWLEVSARAVVNASGAAVDAVRRLEDARAGTSVTLSKGAHLVLERDGAWAAALTIPVDRERVSFAIPWEGLLLLGTTDSAFDPERDGLGVTPAEEAQILAEAGRALPPGVVRPDAVRARFAGLRVLPLTNGATARASREVTLTRGPAGMVSVAGGKLTTYRLIAQAALDRVRADLDLRRVDRRPFPLPGAGDPALVTDDLRRSVPELEPETARHLARTYGTRARDVLAHAADRPDALDPVAAGALDVVAQLLYARDREWALDADDVLRRRTTLSLRGLDSPALRELVTRCCERPGAAAMTESAS